MDRSQQQRNTERERKTFGYATALGEAMRRARNAQGNVSTKTTEARLAPHTAAETPPQPHSVSGEPPC